MSDLHTLRAAVLTPSVMTAAACGGISAEEVGQLGLFFSYSPIFAGCSDTEFAALFTEVQRDLATEGQAALAQRTKAELSPRLRETAVAFAMRIAFADGTVSGPEADLIVTLAQGFDIPEETYDIMTEVVMILHRGPDA